MRFVLYFCLYNSSVKSEKCNYLLSIDIAAVILTATAIKRNPNVWKRIDRGDYLVIFALLEILLEVQSLFWLRTVKMQDNEFCQWLVCIVIN